MLVVTTDVGLRGFSLVSWFPATRKLQEIDKGFARVERRPEVWIVLQPAYQAGPHRIRDDIPDHGTGRFVIPQYVLVAIPLPETLPELLREVYPENCFALRMNASRSDVSDVPSETR